MRGERGSIVAALISGLLVLGTSVGCAGPDAGATLPYVFVPNVPAIIDDQIGRQQAFAQALGSERWDDAIAMAENACRTATARSLPACLNLRIKAYEARAFAHARGSQFDTAITDELVAGQQADALPAANAAFLADVGGLGTPSSVLEMQAKVTADQTARTRAVVQVRLEAYRRQKLPDATVEAVAMSSGVVMPAPGTPPP